jgi:stage V sporulation protein D (sporulation-specific penicillin-binding protein)
MGYILYQVWHIQQVRGRELNQMSSRWRVDRMNHLAEINPHRGWITDRNMNPLAMSYAVYNIRLDVSMLAYRENLSVSRGGANRTRWMDDTLGALHEALNIPMENLTALFVRGDGIWQPVIQDNWRLMARQIPANIAIPLRDNYRDIYLEEVSVRAYADAFFAPQVLGFLRGDARLGLELRYAQALTGTPGRLFRAFDANNILIRDEIPVQHGHTLVTTIDVDIQRLAQQTVDNAFRNLPTKAVAMLVMCPFTAEIYAMAQAPNFSLAEPTNAALFTDPTIHANWDNMSESERVTAWNTIWRNYHTTHTFEPGSVFKPIVIAAALEEGTLTTQCVFHCTGAITVEGVEITCFNRTVHGTVTVTDVIAASCNVATIQIMHRLGRDSFYRFRGYFGYGERTGIDLPGEESVSSPAVMYALNQLGPVQLATSSIGQGFNHTMIQGAVSYAALINGGNVMRPFVVSHIIDENGAVVAENRPQVVRRVLSAETADWMRTALEQVVIGQRGTGRSTRITGHTIGGKTGTAQHGPQRELVSIGYWVYTPVENPEFLIYIVAENVTPGIAAGSTLGPIMRGFLEELIILRSMPPSEGPYIEDWRSPVLDLERMPDFVGFRVKDVAENLITRGIPFQIIGGGTIVTSTFPGAEPGRTLPQPGGIPVQIHTDPLTYVYGSMSTIPHLVGLSATQANAFAIDARFVPVWFGGDGALTDYEVTHQYPAAGTIAEQGMKIMLRVRRNGS